MRLSALRIALLYCAISAAWIATSDSVLAFVVRDPQTQSLVSIVKGWAFVATTGTLLFILVRQHAAQVDRAHRQAATAAERFERLVEVSGLAIMTCEQDGTVISWNPAAERMFGWTAGEIIGSRSLWVPDDDLEAHRAHMAAVAAGRPQEAAIRRRRRKDGTLIWIRTWSAAMHDIDGRIVLMASMEDVTRDEEAERSLASAAEWNRVLFERNPLPIFLIDPATDRYVDVNEAAVATYGWSREQLLQMRVPDHLPPGERERFGSVAANQGGRTVEAEPWRHLRADGSAILVEVSGRAVQIGDRRLWLGLGRDITERDAAARRLQRLVDRLEGLHALDAEILQLGTVEDVASRALAHIRGMIAADRASVTVIDAESSSLRIVAVDEVRMLGRPAGTVMTLSDALATGTGASLVPMLIRDVPAGAASMPPTGSLPEAMRHGVQTVLSLPLVVHGSLLGQLNLGSLAHDAFDTESVEIAGEIADQLAIALQQARYREQLLASQERFRRLLAASPNATLLVDRGGTIRYANEVTSQIFGVDPGALLGRKVDEFVPLGGRDRHADLRALSADDGGRLRGIRRFDGIARRTDGTEFPVDMSLSPIETPDGPMVVATVMDLTERTALEAQLRQAQKMEVMGQFANILAHDFRNYLTAIGGFADLLADDVPEDDPRRADVEEIRKAVSRAGDLVRNVLAFARPESGPPASTNLGSHLRDVSGMLSRLLEPRARLEVDVPPDVPSVAMAPTQLTQVLVNLATNARDAMPAGGTLRITASPAEVAAGDPSAPDFVLDRRVHLEVRDTGTGMDDATRAHIFEPFFTTKAAGEGDGKGSGLGLASVFTIVRRAHGRIEVRSAPGAGTSFLIDLPAA